MTCERFPIGGGVAILCSRRRGRDPGCAFPGCGRPTTALCDWPLAGGSDRYVGNKRGRTCSRRMCDLHRVKITAGVDICTVHANAAQLQTCRKCDCLGFGYEDGEHPGICVCRHSDWDHVHLPAQAGEEARGSEIVNCPECGGPMPGGGYTSQCRLRHCGCHDAVKCGDCSCEEATP